MTEKEYKRCISQALCPEYDAMLFPIEPEHSFSVTFETKMQKLIKQRNKPYYSMINTVGKRAAVIILAFFVMSFTTVMSVEALRKPFLSFITNIFSSHSQIRSETDSSRVYPAAIEKKYDISAGTQNFERTIVYERKDCISIHYSKGNKVIDLEQHTVDSFDGNYNTEKTTTEHVDINGNDAIGWLDNHDYYTLIWNNGEYVIEINSNLEKTQVIEIARSVQKAQ